MGPSRNVIKYGPIIALGAFIRLWMFRSNMHIALVDRVEISTPLNSWKRVVEGVYLQNHFGDAYAGDLFHESPINLALYSYLTQLDGMILKIFFIASDVITAILVSIAARKFFTATICDQLAKEELLHADSKELVLKTEPSLVSSDVVAAYMLNPYIICSCVAMTTTVFTNLILAIALLAIAVKSRTVAVLAVAIAVQQTFYPVILLAPIAVTTAGDQCKIRSTLITMATFILCTLALVFVSWQLSGSWRFLDASFGCILMVPDCTPNIGLFWYFFTEMFDHFYDFFTCVFQLNPFVYVVPLSLRFQDNVPLLSFALFSIIAIFKSYPSVGDVGFYLAMLPLWRHLMPFFRHSFVVGCILLVTSVLSPILWYLWIYTGSANANFFFANTLAFATAQIFLLTDVLFAQAKYDYHMQHGLELKINGKEGQLVLE